MLASASARRRQLLDASGIEFVVEIPSFDESTLRGLPGRKQAMAAARGKAVEVYRRRRGEWIVGCDTVVVLDDECLGKPRGPEDAALMLRRLQGREHAVITAVSVISPDGRHRSGAASSQVGMDRLSPARLKAYVGTGEPLDKAGAYAIQGMAGEFTRLIAGELDTVVGLPMRLLQRLLSGLGYRGGEWLSDNLDRA